MDENVQKLNNGGEKHKRKKTKLDPRYLEKINTEIKNASR